MSEALDEFGKLVTVARDQALDQLEWLFDGRARAPALQALSQKLRALGGAEHALIREAVKESLDVAIHKILFDLYMDERIAISLDGADIKDASDGFHGDYLTDEGWIGRFGKHPE